MTTYCVVAPSDLICLGALIAVIGIGIGAAIVGACWSTHNTRMAEAAKARTAELMTVRDDAENDLIRAATKRLEDNK